MASVVTGSTLIPSWLIMNLRYSVSVWWNSHFEGFSFIPDWYIELIIFPTSCLCCSRLSEYIRTSSKYSIQQRSIKRCSVRLIHLGKVAGALHSPNGITKYSYVPYWLIKVVFLSSPFLNLTLWYASLISSLVKYFAVCNRRNASPISGNGQRSYFLNFVESSVIHA